MPALADLQHVIVRADHRAVAAIEEAHGIIAGLDPHALRCLGLCVIELARHKHALPGAAILLGVGDDLAGVLCVTGQDVASHNPTLLAPNSRALVEQRLDRQEFRLLRFSVVPIHVAFDSQRVATAYLRERQRDRFRVTVGQSNVHLPGRRRGRVGCATRIHYIGNNAVERCAIAVSDRNARANRVGLQHGIDVTCGGFSLRLEFVDLDRISLV